MKSIFLFGILILLTNCSSTSHSWRGDYDAAVGLVKEGKEQLASQRFAVACLHLNAAACDVVSQPVKLPVERLAIMQGATSETTTEIAILERRDSQHLHYLWRQGSLELIPVASDQVFTQGPSQWQVRQLRYEGLKKDAIYSLQILDETGALLDLRRLHSLDTSRHALRFIEASCMDDFYKNEQIGMWQDAVALNPDFMLFLGDNSYADRWNGQTAPATPDTLWERYAQTRNLLEVFRADVLIPIFAVWDDHDYGINDGDRTYPHKDESLKVFRAFFPMQKIDGFLAPGPGASSQFEAGGQRFVLLDDRYFRSPLKEPDQTHFGEQQEKWLLDLLHENPMPTWLLSGDQFFGGYHQFESYEGNHPKSFKEFLKNLRKVASPIVFVSGDRHLVEIMEIKPKEMGYRTYELTSSAIHAQTYPDTWKEHKNPRQIAGAAGVFNYMHVEARAERRAIGFTATAMGPNKKVLFTRRLHVNR